MRVRSQIIESPTYRSAKRANKKLFLEAQREEHRLQHQRRRLFIEKTPSITPKHHSWQQYSRRFYANGNMNTYQARG